LRTGSRILGSIGASRENTRAGLRAARRNGNRLGRPRAERRHADQKGARLDVDAVREMIAGGCVET
jgi:DNA invertase Pin-like site-specific DNA recombinase